MKQTLFIFLLFFLPLQLFAQCDSVYWSTNPAENLQVSTWGLSPLAVSDGKGGVYISWESFDYEYSDLYLQYVNKCGKKQWEPPLFIGDIGNFQTGNVALVEDSSGGVIVGWDDLIPRDTIEFTILYKGRLRTQRIDSAGTKLWGDEGVKVSLDDGRGHRIISAVSDNADGVVVLFTTHTEYGVSTDSSSLRIQRISNSGERLWGENGILFDYNIWGHRLLMVSDRDSGVILQYGVDGEAQFQRLNALGDTIWTVSSLNGYSNIISDNNGGAILGVSKWLSPYYNRIIANRISVDGEFLWGEEGMVLSDSVGSYSKITDVIIKNDSIVVLYWTEVVNLQNDIQTYLQMIRPNGDFIFESGGISPSLVSVSYRIGAGTIESDNNSMIFLFLDNRDESQNAVYAQKLGPMGEILWESSDVMFSYFPRQHSIFVKDISYGIIDIGSDEPMNGIFAQQISRNGNLGEVNTDSVSVNVENRLPKGYLLKQNYPNPFNNSTAIKYILPVQSEISIIIFDILGREISRFERFHSTSGNYSVQWSGTDNRGNNIGSGIYFYEIQTNEFREVKKMLLIK